MVERIVVGYGLAVCRLPFASVLEYALNQAWTRDPFDRLIVAQAARTMPRFSRKDGEHSEPLQTCDLVTNMAEIKKTDEEWRKQLTPEQYAVTRKKGTEPAFTGKYWDNHETALISASAAARRCSTPTPNTIPDRMAEFLGADIARERQNGDRHQPWDAARGGVVREVRRAPGPRF